MDKKEQIGVITEQGYVAGQFGFTPLTEADQKKIEDDEKNTKEDDDK